MDAGDKIKILKGKFSFSGSMTKNFDQHVSKSVPLYSIGHYLICKLSSFFLQNKSFAYDLGCSTGELSRKIANYNKHVDFKIISVDEQKSMIAQCKKKLKNNKKIILKKINLRNLKFKKSDFIISYYTMQFIKPKFRQEIFNNIYNSLNWGGGFVLFEKTRGPDARFQDILNQVYAEYKKDIGYNEKQIYEKSLSIRGYLEPFTSSANIAFLKRAGFKDIMSIQKYGPFEGFLAIK
jgi:tRNA (cmo5U34)-methyltransferase